MKAITILVLLPLLLFSPSLVINSASAENILVVAFLSSKSHKLTYLPLIEELGKRGHNMTILSSIKSTKQMKNVNDIMTIDWEELEKKFMGDPRFNPFKTKETQGSTNPFTMLDLFKDFCKDTYDLPVVKQILKDDFDLIILQPMFNDCALGLVHRLKAPLILFFPVGVPGFILEKVGGHLPPSVNSNLFLGYPEEMNFYQRFVNFGFNIMFEAILRFYYEPAMTAIYREKLGEDIPPAREILGNASLILSNGHFSLHRPKALLPDVVEVGGLHSFVPTNPLPKDIEDFIKKGKDGFIFFSMGSAIRASMMPEPKRKMFLSVFSKLKQQVLWKWETESMPDLPKNVKLSKWLPQQDLLAHKDIKMFITHCGGGSTEEAIYSGAPLLGFPMLGDQPINAKLAETHGMIVELDWNDVTEEKLMNGINEILRNPKYRDNAKTLSKLYKDQPDSPMDRAIYWVEYVIRHKGATHLRSAGRKLNWIQYHSYDVILAYFGLIGLAFYLIFALLRWIVRKTCCRSSSAASKKGGKWKRQ